MGIFKKKKNDEAFKIQLEREAMDKINNPDLDDLTLPFDIDDSTWQISGKTRSPHTITAEELNRNSAANHIKNNTSSGIKPVKIPMSNDNSNISSSDFLYNRMMKSRNVETKKAVVTSAAATETKPVAPTVQPAPQVKTPEPVAEPKKAANEQVDIDAMIKSLKNSVMPTAPNTEENVAEDKVVETIKVTPTVDSSPSVEVAQTPKEPQVQTPPTPVQMQTAEERRTSLLARCNAYLEDDELGSYKIDTEKYKLESVESILEGLENRASQRAVKRFGTGVLPTTPITTPKAPSMPETPKVDIEKTIVIPSLETTANPEVTTPAVDVKTEIPQVKRHFTVDDNEQPDKPMEDISSTRVIDHFEDISSTTVINDLSDKTGVFAPITSSVTGAHTEINSDDSSALYDDTSSDEEYNFAKDKEGITNTLYSGKKRLTLRSFITFLILIPSLFLLTPLGSSIDLPTAKIVDLVLCVFALLCNIGVFKSIFSLFSAKSEPDVSISVAAVATTIFSIANVLLNGKMVGFSAVMIFALLINNLAKRTFYSRAIKNFNLVENEDRKRAIAIVKNKSVTKTMVGNAIDGGSLICCGVESTNIRNFLKYTYSSSPVAGKIKKITIFGLILSLGFAIASALLNSGDMVHALYFFALTLCITAAPAAVLISILPFKSADARLKLYDAMLTGYRAADELDLCNGIAISCLDLFPEGSIRLVDMKILSPNPFDQSILDAAALAENIGSPLSGIFKQVNITSSYTVKNPMVDSVVYEEKMGISGWVNDRRVFVGNRVLMEAHGFTSLPPIELDKKIMRKGYFPVYLASDNIPCALFVVKYTTDEDVAYELRRLCNTGTTVLIHNCDPNISDPMVCDYFGVHDDTISVMSKHGSDQYNILTAYKRERSAGAAFKRSVCGFLAIMTASINIKKSISLMTAIYIACTVLGLCAVGALIFLSSTIGYFTPIAILLFNIISTILICLPPLIHKP